MYTFYVPEMGLQDLRRNQTVWRMARGATNSKRVRNVIRASAASGRGVKGCMKVNCASKVDVSTEDLASPRTGEPSMIG